MNNELQVFRNSEFGALDVLMIGDKAYFPATECARLLGYANPQKAIRDHCEGVNETVTRTAGGNQTIKIIPEGDLYRLIARSNLPGAVRFEKWVFDEVLPSIRKHGAYVTEPTIDKILADPDFGIKLLTELKQEQARNAALAAHNDELAAHNDELAVQLNESEKFWTIMKFNQRFNMRWDMKTCRRNGKMASAYSRQHGYEIKHCQTNDDRFESTGSYAYEVLEKLFLPGSFLKLAKRGKAE